MSDCAPTLPEGQVIYTTGPNLLSVLILIGIFIILIVGAVFKSIDIYYANIDEGKEKNIGHFESLEIATTYNKTMAIIHTDKTIVVIQIGKGKSVPVIPKGAECWIIETKYNYHWFTYSGASEKYRLEIM